MLTEIDIALLKDTIHKKLGEEYSSIFNLWLEGRSIAEISRIKQTSSYKVRTKLQFVLSFVSENVSNQRQLYLRLSQQTSEF